MDLSISIVSWNTEDLLDQCLESIYRTTGDASIEVIVVDNASSDGSVEMVRSKYGQVRVLVNTDNVGFARANNQAYEASSGRYLMLLNPDTIVQSDLSAIVRYMDANPSVGAASCRCLNPDGSIQRNWYDSYPSFGWDMMPHSLREMLLRVIYRRNADSEFSTKWVGGQCMTVRRECIEQVGAMDPGYFMYSEETDWCFRIRRSGWDVRHCPGIVVTHLGGQSTKQASTKMLIELYRSKVLFLRRNRSQMHAGAFRFGLLLRTGLFWCAAALRAGREERRLKQSQLASLIHAVWRF